MVTLTAQQSENIKSALLKPNTRYGDLRALLPEGWSDKTCVKTLRQVAAGEVAKKLKDLPKSKHPMPDTVQTARCKWLGQDSHLHDVKIVGFRHGMVTINRRSVASLKKEIVADESATLLCEKNIGLSLGVKNIDPGKDLNDHRKRRLINVTVSAVSLAYVLLSPYFITKYCINEYKKARGHYKKHYDTYPKYYDRMQHLTKSLPEHIEIDMYKELPTKVSGSLDRGLIRTAVNGRSGYMAGYIAATVENTDKSVVFSCGGGHLPRIKSLLDFGSRDAMPKSLQKDFDLGYTFAMKDMKKSGTLPN